MPAVRGAGRWLGGRRRPAAGRAVAGAGPTGRSRSSCRARFGVSALVTMARDPAQLAAQIRRPMPRRPAPRAERGTAFHRWLEERFGQHAADRRRRPGGAVDADLVGDDADLAELKARFEAGEWGQRWPAEVEVPFETRVERPARPRAGSTRSSPTRRAAGSTSWTGRPAALPRPAAEERAVAVQLAAYRLAWAALAGVPVEEVRAAFYYVRREPDRPPGRPARRRAAWPRLIETAAALTRAP